MNVLASACDTIYCLHGCIIVCFIWSYDYHNNQQLMLHDNVHCGCVKPSCRAADKLCFPRFVRVKVWMEEPFTVNGLLKC